MLSREDYFFPLNVSLSIFFSCNFSFLFGIAVLSLFHVSFVSCIAFLSCSCLFLNFFPVFRNWNACIRQFQNKFRKLITKILIIMLKLQEMLTVSSYHKLKVVYHKNGGKIILSILQFTYIRTVIYFKKRYYPLGVFVQT